MRTGPAGVVLREQAADAGQAGTAHALSDLHQLVHSCRATPFRLAARRQGTGSRRWVTYPVTFIQCIHCIHIHCKPAMHQESRKAPALCLETRLCSSLVPSCHLLTSVHQLCACFVPLLSVL